MVAINIYFHHVYAQNFFEKANQKCNYVKNITNWSTHKTWKLVQIKLKFKLIFSFTWNKFNMGAPPIQILT